MQEKLLKHFFDREAPKGDLSREQWETVLSFVKTQRQRRTILGILPVVFRSPTFSIRRS